MKDNVEYQIFIGCRDPQSGEELVGEQELRDTVARFFESRHIDFSLLSAKGGYRHADGHFVTESTLCVNLIGPRSRDIVKLARNLSMYMNQERALIVRNPLKTAFY